MVAYRFKDLVHYWHGKKLGMQAEMVLQKYLRIVHLDPQAAGRERPWAYGLFSNFKSHPQ